MNIGEKIREIRKQNNLTLKDVHNKTGLSISFISDIEHGRRKPSITNLKVISEGLNISMTYLLESDKTLYNGYIGDRIKSLRKELNITQIDLANSIGISQSDINIIENNKQNLSIEMLIKIANVLECTISYLLQDNNYKDLKLILDELIICNKVYYGSKELDDKKLKKIKKYINTNL